MANSLRELYLKGSPEEDEFAASIKQVLEKDRKSLKSPSTEAKVKIEDEDATTVPAAGKNPRHPPSARVKFQNEDATTGPAARKREITGRTMALSEVDIKFLGQFARNVESDNYLLSKTLFQLVGNFTMMSPWVVKARKQLKAGLVRSGDVIQDWERVIWYAKEALQLIEERAVPMVANYTELRVLIYKLRASCYHLFVLFHNQPEISLKSGQISTPPGLKSPRVKLEKGKGNAGIPTPPTRPSSIQPTHPLEGGPVGGTGSNIYLSDMTNFLIPGKDYRPIALGFFKEANATAEKLLWGSHPLRLSVKVEYTAFLYDCLHQRDQSRNLAKKTIAEVYNAQEGMDDEMFEEAAQLVGLLGKMSRRGLGSAESGRGSSGARTASPGKFGQQVNVDSPGMDNPI